MKVFQKTYSTCFFSNIYIFLFDFNVYGPHFSKNKDPPKRLLHTNWNKYIVSVYVHTHLWSQVGSNWMVVTRAWGKKNLETWKPKIQEIWNTNNVHGCPPRRFCWIEKLYVVLWTRSTCFCLKYQYILVIGFKLLQTTPIPKNHGSSKKVVAPH